MENREESGVEGLKVADQDYKGTRCVGILFCHFITPQSRLESIEIPRLRKTLFAQGHTAVDMHLFVIFAAYSKAEVLNQEGGSPSLPPSLFKGPLVVFEGIFLIVIMGVGSGGGVKGGRVMVTGI